MTCRTCIDRTSFIWWLPLICMRPGYQHDMASNIDSDMPDAAWQVPGPEMHCPFLTCHISEARSRGFISQRNGCPEHLCPGGCLTQTTHAAVPRSAHSYQHEKTLTDGAMTPSTRARDM